MVILTSKDFLKTSFSNITRIGNPILKIIPRIQRSDIQLMIQSINLPSINITQRVTQYSTLVNQFALTRYEIFKKSTENISEHLMYLLSKISKKQKMVKIEEIRKITKRLDSIDSKNANEIMVEIITKYRVDPKSSDEELEAFLSSKSIDMKKIALLGLFLTIVFGVLGLVLPKSREKMIMTLTA